MPEIYLSGNFKTNLPPSLNLNNKHPCIHQTLINNTWKINPLTGLYLLEKLQFSVPFNYPYRILPFCSFRRINRGKIFQHWNRPLIFTAQRRDQLRHHLHFSTLARREVAATEQDHLHCTDRRRSNASNLKDQ